MSEPFLAEIKMFAGNFAPTGYALCNGQLLPISQNTALFSLVGTFYGGNGVSTFGLPNLQGRTPMNTGQGPGLSQRDIGELAGEENVALITAEMPAHTHGPQAGAFDLATPTNAIWASGAAGRTPPPMYQTASNTTMNPQAVGPAGGSQPHNNLQPYLTITFIIAMAGIFPSRN